MINSVNLFNIVKWCETVRVIVIYNRHILQVLKIYYEFSWAILLVCSCSLSIGIPGNIATNLGVNVKKSYYYKNLCYHF